jgi:hypothetical protein
MKNGTYPAICLAAAVLAGAAEAQTAIDLRTQTKGVDFSGAPSTKPSKTGTTLPAACSAGETFFKTDAPAGQNWFGCSPDNTWSLQGGGAVGGVLPAISGHEGNLLSNDGAAAQWRALGGDVSGPPEAASVTGIRGRNIAPAAPENGHVLKWNSSAGQWEPGPDTGGPAGANNYSQGFTAQTTVSISAAAHGMGTANLIVQCYDNASPAARIEPDSVSVDPASYDVRVAFSNPQTGRCVVNGSGGSSGGAVSSVFGRGGAVAAQAGDYSFAQISGTVPDSQIGAGISAAKIGAGMVDDTKFGFLAGVTGDIQAQLNGKALSGHIHTGGGDLSGDTGNATVTRIRNRTVSSAPPGDGQALVWNAAAGAWEPGTVAGGGGGASSAAQLRDLDAVRSSATVLTVGGSCSTNTPCNVRFGNTVYSLTRSCTATISAGSGNAYIYVASGGTLTVGHNVTVSASAGCLAQGSVTSFPPDSVPLSIWTATGGMWDEGGGRDLRGWLSTKTLTAGVGIASVETAGRTVVNVDTATVPMYLSGSAQLNFPSISGGTCSADYTFALPGAAVQDALAAGWPAGFEPGLFGFMRISAASTVAVRICNLSGSPVDPGSGTFRATVVRSF